MPVQVLAIERDGAGLWGAIRVFSRVRSLLSNAARGHECSVDRAGWIVSGYLVLTASAVAYCLYTGLKISPPRRWYDRALRVSVAALASYLALLLFFGDS